jgi:hypothetical protein
MPDIHSHKDERTSPRGTRLTGTVGGGAVQTWCCQVIYPHEPFNQAGGNVVFPSMTRCPLPCVSKTPNLIPLHLQACNSENGFSGETKASSIAGAYGNCATVASMPIRPLPVSHRRLSAVGAVLLVPTDLSWPCTTTKSFSVV